MYRLMVLKANSCNRCWLAVRSELVIKALQFTMPQLCDLHQSVESVIDSATYSTPKTCFELYLANIFPEKTNMVLGVIKIVQKVELVFAHQKTARDHGICNCPVMEIDSTSHPYWTIQVVHLLLSWPLCSEVQHFSSSIIGPDMFSPLDIERGN
ncbi:hypothetical protein V6N11_075880 [Hibiscus sabdariffa]|uniref:Uncharacterized protein n=1 Tax=Hibiscus sabdariffa TaxID=183260 RepID=A0ABR2Q4M5_9ROSI